MHAILVARRGFEPLTPTLGRWCSIQLNYRTNWLRYQYTTNCIKGGFTYRWQAGTIIYSVMPYKYFTDQFDDEEVLLVFRKHPVVMRRAIIYASLLLLLPVLYVGGLTYFKADNPPSIPFFFGCLALGILLFFVVMFYAWIGWNFSIYIMTNQRFIQMSQKGLWKRSVIDIGLDKIQTISYEVNGLQETLLGFGTIVIQTYVGELVIHEVHHPKHIQKQMSHILRELGISANIPAGTE